MTCPVRAWNMRERVEAVLHGDRPDRLPFVDRLELWFAAHKSANTIPESFVGMQLSDIYHSVGMGQQIFVTPYGIKLRGVEVVSTHNGREIFREWEPELSSFPGMWDIIPRQSAGVTVTELRTRVEKVSVCHELSDTMIASGMDPYMKTHLIQTDDDYQTVEHILSRAEYVPHYERVSHAQSLLNDFGFVVPQLPRIPFQQVLLEYLGEISLFYALYDNPKQVQRLMRLLDEQLQHILREVAGLSALYVEFPDNLHDQMTNPRLFEKYCLPYYQCYADILHGQGKKIGSHTDGNLRTLLVLLKESGLDVCESVSPVPLSQTTFEEMWSAWQGRPIIWGGIPSSVLEVERTSEKEFQEYIRHVLQLAGSGPIILGIGDLVMPNNSIERLRYIAEEIALHPLGN